MRARDLLSAITAIEPHHDAGPRLGDAQAFRVEANVDALPRQKFGDRIGNVLVCGSLYLVGEILSLTQSSGERELG